MITLIWQADGDEVYGGAGVEESGAPLLHQIYKRIGTVIRDEASHLQDRPWACSWGIM